MQFGRYNSELFEFHEVGISGSIEVYTMLLGTDLETMLKVERTVSEHYMLYGR